MQNLKYLFVLVVALLLSTPVFTQNYTGPKKEIDAILNNARAFSEYFVAGDMESLVNLYSEDASIFPNNQPILSGREALAGYWTVSPDVTVHAHRIEPVELTVAGDTAYDYGYYYGTTQKEGSPAESWKGKYVIVWKKVDGEWKMYLDIWNRVAE